MTIQDIPAAMRLKDLAGWNQVEEDWQFLLRSSPQNCFASVRDSQVVGTVTTIRYGGRVSWIGMLLVDPAHRRQGIGTSLLLAALGSLRDSETIMLDATPAGETMYARYGFRREWRLVRMVVDCLLPVPDPPPDVRPVTPEALEPVVALDQEAFGADRGPLLGALVARAPDLAWHCMCQGPVVGLCLGRRGSRFAQLGPVVADNAGDAALLCRAAFHSLLDKAVVLDVPERQGAFLSWLRELGFVAQRPFVRMVWQGSPSLGPSGPSADAWGRPATDDRRPAGMLGSGSLGAGALELLFAIAGPEFG